MQTLLTSALVAAAALAAPRPPNIVLLFVDDLGYGDLGFTGHPSTLTPALDELAAGGMRLTSWYTAYPVCSASRAALLTGRQPPRVGMPGVINSLSAGGLPLNETTIADHLRAGGYKTLAIGKWHQGQQPQYLPRERGFDRFLGLPFSVDDGEGFASNCTPPAGAAAASVSAGGGVAVGSSAFTAPPRAPPAAVQRVGLGPSLPLPSIRQDNGSSVIVAQPTDLVPLTEQWWNFTRQFLRDFAAEPLFAYVAFGHVHTATPNVPGRQYAGCAFQGTTARGAFGDALAEVDWFAAQLLAELRALALEENTLLLFVSDNGPSLRWGLSAGSVGPFVGAAAAFENGTGYTNTGKGSTWEGGIRMPAFAYWKGRVAPGSHSGEVVSTMDVLPAALKLAGLPPKRGVVDGRASLADILLGRGGSAHAFLPFYNGYYGNVSTEMYAARAGRYKAHWITGPGLGGGRWPTDAHAAAELWRHDPPLLFDVQADPSEMFPLAPDQLPPTLLAELRDAKAAADEGMTLRAITADFGFEWALCCGVGCAAPCDNCTCANVPLPLP